MSVMASVLPVGVAGKELACLIDGWFRMSLFMLPQLLQELF